MIRFTDILLAGGAIVISGLVLWPGVAAQDAAPSDAATPVAAPAPIADAAQDITSTAENGGERRPDSLRDGFRDRGDGPGRGFGRRSHQVSAEQVDSALEVLCEINAERCEQLKKMRSEMASEEFSRLFAQFGRRLISLVRLKDTNPELYTLKIRELKLESQIDTLASHVRDAWRTGSQTAPELEAELRRLVHDQLELRLLVRGQELLLLQQHFDDERQQLNDDALNFDKLVARRIEMLKRERPPQEARRD